MKNGRRPQKKWMEDDLNFKAVLLRLFNNKILKNKWFWHHRDWPSFILKQDVCWIRSAFTTFQLFPQVSLYIYTFSSPCFKVPHSLFPLHSHNDCDQVLPYINLVVEAASLNINVNILLLSGISFYLFYRNW